MAKDQFESPGVGFTINPQPMVFRVAEWRGKAVLIAQSPSAVDQEGSGGFSIQLDTDTAMKLGKMLYHRAKDIKARSEAKASSDSGTGRSPALAAARVD